MAITIKDVARVAGVSHTTVSRALRDNPAISSATTAHVKQIATDLGYVPNRAASGLKTNRSNVIGVIIRRFSDPFNANLLDGIEDVTQAKGFGLIMSVSGNDTAKDERILGAMAEQRIDGLILCSKRIEPEQGAKLHAFNIPTVFINTQSALATINEVIHDDAFGAYELTKHIIDQGHRDIAYIGNGNAGNNNLERQLGYQKALSEANLVIRPESIITMPNGQVSSGLAGANTLLALDNRPSAVVCFNDMVAVGVIHALTDSGLSVPHDLSVTGFDDIELASYTMPPLTTFRQPRYEMGRQSAEMLLNLVSNKDKESYPQLTMRGELIVRESTGPLVQGQI